MAASTNTLSLTEVGERLGISTRQAYQLLIHGKLDSTATPLGRRVVTRAELQRYQATLDQATHH